MAAIIWSNAAIESIASIAEYIAQNSFRYAQLTVEQIFSRVKVLESQPFSGHIVPEINNQNIREIHYKSYRIIYRIAEENNVEIITVHHFSKQLGIDF